MEVEERASRPRRRQPRSRGGAVDSPVVLREGRRDGGRRRWSEGHRGRSRRKSSGAGTGPAEAERTARSIAGQREQRARTFLMSLQYGVPRKATAASSQRLALLAPPALPYRAAAQLTVSPGWSPAGTAPLVRRAGARPPPTCAAKRGGGGGEVSSSDGEGTRALLQAALWGAEAAYILWLFLLPYAPGDPVWAISQATITDLVGLSLNFFFILPLINSAGVHLLESPVIHPMDEGLFNFVIAWTLLFAPLLFTDARRDRYKGSLDVLWSCQMFLTNTFLIPYMAIRLNDPDKEQPPPQASKLSSLMVRGASVVGITGGLVCILSIVWAFFGRADADFGGISDRWQYAQDYVFTERFAYAFICDILLYSIFQPWLIGDNLQNVKPKATEFVSVARFIPVVGIVAYLLCLEDKKD